MKLSNEPYSRIVLMPLVGSIQPVGILITQEPGNFGQQIDFRHVTEATLVLHESRDVEVLLLIRPKPVERKKDGEK